MFNIAVLISGSGSNLQALIDQQTLGYYRIGCVLSNVETAFALTRAQQANIPNVLVKHQDYDTRDAFEAAMIEALDRFKPDLIVLAGFMRILTPHFIEHYRGKMINIHPSLLPKFKGLNTHARAIEAKESEHGATVHYVTSELDGGPLIAQGKTVIYPDDTPNTLAQRVLSIEHQLLPNVVNAIAVKQILLSPSVSIFGQKTPVTLEQLQTLMKGL